LGYKLRLFFDIDVLRGVITWPYWRNDRQFIWTTFSWYFTRLFSAFLPI